MRKIGKKVEKRVKTEASIPTKDLKQRVRAIQTQSMARQRLRESKVIKVILEKEQELSILEKQRYKARGEEAEGRLKNLFRVSRPSQQEFEDYNAKMEVLATIAMKMSTHNEVNQSLVAEDSSVVENQGQKVEKNENSEKSEKTQKLSKLIHKPPNEASIVQLPQESFDSGRSGISEITKKNFQKDNKKGHFDLNPPIPEIDEGKYMRNYNLFKKISKRRRLKRRENNPKLSPLNKKIGDSFKKHAHLPPHERKGKPKYQKLTKSYKSKLKQLKQKNPRLVNYNKNNNARKIKQLSEKPLKAVSRSPRAVSKQKKRKSKKSEKEQKLRKTYTMMRVTDNGKSFDINYLEIPKSDPESAEKLPENESEKINKKGKKKQKRGFSTEQSWKGNSNSPFKHIFDQNYRKDYDQGILLREGRRVPLGRERRSKIYAHQHWSKRVAEKRVYLKKKTMAKMQATLEGYSSWGTGETFHNTFSVFAKQNVSN